MTDDDLLATERFGRVRITADSNGLPLGHGGIFAGTGIRAAVGGGE